MRIMKMIASTSAKTAQLAAAPAQRSCEDVLSGSLQLHDEHSDDDGMNIEYDDDMIKLMAMIIRTH